MAKLVNLFRIGNRLIQYPIGTVRSIVLNHERSLLGLRSFLLQEHDFLPKNDLFLKELTSADQYPFQDGIYEIRDGVNIHRLASILALHSVKDTIVPIPFIVDTGAPFSFYLGTGAIKTLGQYGLLTKVEGLQGEVGRLNGDFSFKNKKFREPIVLEVPRVYEDRILLGDVRVSIIGLPAISYFKLLTWETVY